MGLASCGGTSASDNPDIVVEDTLDKDSIAEPKNADGESLQLKEALDRTHHLIHRYLYQFD